MATIKGERELFANFDRITNSVVGRQLDKTCTEALQPMKKETEVNARALRQPGRTPKGGHLDQGVAIGKRNSSRFQRTFWLAFRRRARRIAHLVEFGTAPHFQPARGVMHPGARPKPFIRPAFESQKGTVALIFAERLWDAIQSAAKSTKR